MWCFRCNTFSIEDSHVFAIDHKHKNETIKVDLPFPFEYYGFIYNQIAISPLGYISFLKDKNDTKVDMSFTQDYLLFSSCLFDRKSKRQGLLHIWMSQKPCKKFYIAFYLMEAQL